MFLKIIVFDFERQKVYFFSFQKNFNFVKGYNFPVIFLHLMFLKKSYLVCDLMALANNFHLYEKIFDSIKSFYTE